MAEKSKELIFEKEITPYLLLRCRFDGEYISLDFGSSVNFFFSLRFNQEEWRKFINAVIDLDLDSQVCQENLKKKGKED